jgi:phosphoglycerate dehydrogenase-like enzyme
MTRTPHVLLSGSALADGVDEQLRDRGCEVHRVDRPAPFSGTPLCRTPEAREFLSRADVVVVSPHERLTDDDVARAPRLRGVVSLVIGVDTIAVDAVHDRGLLVAHGAVEENFLGVAEASATLLASVLLDLPAKEEVLRGTRTVEPEAMLGRMVRGRTVGLLGFGRSARGVVDRLGPWGVRFIAHDPYVDAATLPEGVELADLDEMLTRSDAVSVHVVLTPETHHLLDESRLRRMPRGAHLVNLSRGAVIDEQALARVLADGHLGSVALDVFETEPLPHDSPLRDLDGVVLTPHMAGHSAELRAALPVAALDNVVALLEGRRPPILKSPTSLVDDWVAAHPALLPSDRDADRTTA